MPYFLARSTSFSASSRKATVWAASHFCTSGSVQVVLSSFLHGPHQVVKKSIITTLLSRFAAANAWSSVRSWNGPSATKPLESDHKARNRAVNTGENPPLRKANHNDAPLAALPRSGPLPPSRILGVALWIRPHFAP